MMDGKENIRHYFGLVFASIGGLGLLLGLGLLAGSAIMAVRGKGEATAGLFGCSLVSTLPSLFLFRRGIGMRKRAIAAGSTMHLEGTGFGTAPLHSSRTETKRPSFLKDGTEGEGADES